jgi:hypothetical protein
MLGVVVGVAGLVPGEEGGKLRGRLDQIHGTGRSEEHA